jgi:hypothetical protein
MVSKPLESLVERVLLESRRFIETYKTNVKISFYGESDTEKFKAVTAWGNADQRKMALSQIRKLLRQRKATRYVQVAEAWLSENLCVSPSCDPGRKEVLVVAGVDKIAGDKILRVFPIERHSDGTRTIVGIDGWQDQPDYDQIEGDCLTLLDADLSYN